MEQRDIIFKEQEVIDMIVSLGESLNTDVESSISIIQEVMDSLRRKLGVPMKPWWSLKQRKNEQDGC